MSIKMEPDSPPRAQPGWQQQLGEVGCSLQSPAPRSSVVLGETPVRRGPAAFTWYEAPWGRAPSSAPAPAVWCPGLTPTADAS